MCQVGALLKLVKEAKTLAPGVEEEPRREDISVSLECPCTWAPALPAAVPSGQYELAPTGLLVAQASLPVSREHLQCKGGQL